MKVLTIVGNRPQFVKAAPLSLAFREQGIDEVSLHTGQHYDHDLSQVFYEELGLEEPKYSLDVRSADRELMKPGIAAAVAAEEPDWVLVFGDTNTTRAGAEAAEPVPVAHVEAGARSYDKSMPEERNRIAVDHMATLLLCTDERSAGQAREENLEGRIEVVGDVMADATRLFGPMARERSTILDRLDLAPGDYHVMTIHREANANKGRVSAILEDAAKIELPVMFVAHPRTRNVIDENEIPVPANIRLVEPLGYFDFTALASQARTIITDSGGLQKEAYWYGVPCITVRPSTEWVDTLFTTANVLVEPFNIANVVAAFERRGIPSGLPALYGDGYASERIAAALYASGS